jgi:hypothetical protein
MPQIAWNANAAIVPRGNKLGYSGTLADCLTHWRYKLSSIDQVTCFIMITAPIEGKVCLEPEDIAKLIGSDLSDRNGDAN